MMFLFIKKVDGIALACICFRSLVFISRNGSISWSSAEAAVFCAAALRFAFTAFAVAADVEADANAVDDVMGVKYLPEALLSAQ